MVPAALLLLAGCATSGPRPPQHGEQAPPSPTPAPTAAPSPTPTPTPPPPRLVLAEETWSDLPGWNEDAAGAALPALLSSCGVWRKRDPAATLGEQGVGGTVGAWLPLCDRAAALAVAPSPRGASPTMEAAPTPSPPPDAAVRALFEELLRPVAVSNRGDREGLFTGYYEPTLRGSRVEGGAFTVPLYLRPPELVSVELGRFRADLKGKRIAGKVEDGTLVPYFDRKAIEEGALAGRGLELVWVDDPVDAFFLHIQGSGRVVLTDGSELRVGYDGQNGYVYSAIGRELLKRGALAKEQMSMQSIREWLAANPDEAREVMRTNASYVFFRELGEEGPVGSLGVVLTPERSLAVDPLFVPLGVPVWIDTTIPAGAPGGARPLQRLLVAQDTGGAINGPVRGDVFWGPGDEAAATAGSMRQPGRLWLLLPKTVALPDALTTLDEPAPAPPG
ncbi:MAG TPA: MltA domain-containing protein [Thermoanaerobaculia bacterium]|nr:MltA domain-containing protein [Thermoanaerobaculia bacterium]